MSKPVRVFVGFVVFFLFILLLPQIPSYYAHPLLIWVLLLLFLWYFLSALLD